MRFRRNAVPRLEAVVDVAGDAPFWAELTAALPALKSLVPGTLLAIYIAGCRTATVAGTSRPWRFYLLRVEHVASDGTRSRMPSIKEPRVSKPRMKMESPVAVLPFSPSRNVTPACYAAPA
jgi:hypothetical protein